MGAVLSGLLVMGATAGASLTLADLPVGDDPPAMSGFTLSEHRRAPAMTLAHETPRAWRTAAGEREPSFSGAARGRVLGSVRAAELRHGLPPGLLDALISVESAYRPWAVSRAGAAGLTQLMPGTAGELGVFDRFDPLQSIDGGALYLRRLIERFGSISLALAAYNAGPGAVLKARGIPFNGETPAYVRRVLRQWTLAGGAGNFALRVAYP